MQPFEDPNHEGNSAKYHTGKLCITGCGRPAGTRWSKYWCHVCNVERMHRLKELVAKLEQLNAQGVIEHVEGGECQRS